MPNDENWENSFDAWCLINDWESYAIATNCGASRSGCLEVLAAGGNLLHYSDALCIGASHAECLEFLAAGGNLAGYADALGSGASHAECLEVLAGYTVALGSGASHAECLEILAAGGDLAGYTVALGSGASHAECLEILAAGGGLFDCIWALEDGASHAECMEVLAAGGDLSFYPGAIKSGASHAECMEVLAAGDDLSGYSDALGFGASHAECMEVLAAGGNLSDYAEVIDSGASHAECLEVLAAGCDLSDYAGTPDSGVSHAECMEVLAAGGDLGRYVYTLGFGASHAECMEVLAAGGDMAGYAIALDSGISHAICMEVLTVGNDLSEYPFALRDGVSHAECMEFLAAGGIYLALYSEVLRSGVSHAECVEFLAAGGDMYPYSCALEVGASHAECMEVLAAGGDLRLYNYYSVAVINGASYAEVSEADARKIGAVAYTLARSAGEVSGTGPALGYRNDKDPVELVVPHSDVMDAHAADVDLGEYSQIRRLGVSHSDAVNRLVAAKAEVEPYRWLLKTVVGLGGAEAARAGADESQILRLAVEACIGMPFHPQEGRRNFGTKPVVLPDWLKWNISSMMNFFILALSRKNYTPGEAVRSLIRLSQSDALTEDTDLIVGRNGELISVLPDIEGDPSGWHTGISVIDRGRTATVRFKILDNHMAEAYLDHVLLDVSGATCSAGAGISGEECPGGVLELLVQMMADNSDSAPVFAWAIPNILIGVDSLMKSMTPDSNKFDPATFGRNDYFPAPSPSSHWENILFNKDLSDDF